MAKQIADRLRSLKERRQGLDRITRLAADSASEVLAKSYVTESYAGRAPNTPYTTYALGAMQAVDAGYTKISIGEAERVANQLGSGLGEVGIRHQFQLQGSVPCDIHIRGVSDVDLLVIHEESLVYDASGAKARMGYYSPATTAPLAVLRRLRAETERLLKGRFPAADVDTAGSKAVKISKGSLKRPVDVVPAHWYDSAQYQLANDFSERGVYVYDKRQDQTTANRPFLHIKRINERDAVTGGGVKKAIRLCKHVKADAIDAGTQVNLPSFDIAAVMWHADQHALNAGAIYELAILAETQRHLDVLARNHSLAKTLMVPDGGRIIFDTTEKLNGLNRLSMEIDQLAIDVAKERQLVGLFESPAYDVVRQRLQKAYIP